MAAIPRLLGIQSRGTFAALLVLNVRFLLLAVSLRRRP